MSKTARGYSLGFAPIAVILAVVFLAGSAFFLGKSISPSLFNRQTQPTTPSAEPQIPSGWQQQTNQNFGISFMLPQNWDSVEVSDSLVIAPLEVVEDVRNKIAKGYDFGGGTFLTMQVHILDEDYPPDTFESTAEQEVTKKDATVGGNTATGYTSKRLTALPGIEQGAIIKTYLLSANGKKYSFTLLDKNQAETLQKILSSIKFIKPLGSELLGKTKDEVKSQKGDPAASSQNDRTKKEIWVYLDQKDDSSGTYVYFEEEKVANVKVDEYNGTFESEDWLK